MTSPADDLVFTVEDEPDLTIPEDKIVPGKLVDLTIRNFKWVDRNDRDNPGVPIEKEGQTLVWWFQVTSGEYEGRKIKGETRTKISNNPRNKFGQWASTLTGKEIEPGVNIYKSDLVGLPCEFSVRHRKDKNDPSKFYEEIDEVIPVTGDFDYNSEPPF